MNTQQEIDWTPTTKELPPQGQIVLAIDSSGHIQKLVFDCNIWWFPDQSMYVYFTPQFWKALPPTSIDA